MTKKVCSVCGNEAELIRPPKTMDVFGGSLHGTQKTHTGDRFKHRITTPAGYVEEVYIMVAAKKDSPYFWCEKGIINRMDETKK